MNKSNSRVIAALGIRQVDNFKIGLSSIVVLYYLVAGGKKFAGLSTNPLHSMQPQIHQLATEYVEIIRK